jgi:hypothetical protein
MEMCANTRHSQFRHVKKMTAGKDGIKGSNQGREILPTYFNLNACVFNFKTRQDK